MTIRIDYCRLDAVRVSPKTVWLFLTLAAADGVRGIGEASLNQHEDEVRAAAERLAPALLGLDAGQPAGLAARLPYASLPEAAFVSAASQALWDAAARRRGIAVAEALGGARRRRIPLYANINRKTEDRSPQGFAATARLALARGYDAFKIAPFDEVRPGQDAAAVRRGIGLGLPRAAAVRGAVGGGARLMVDCHWRFDERGARELVAAAAGSGLGLYWIECPTPETADHYPALRGLRAQANAAGIRLAGAEHMSGLAGFAPLLAAGVYDAMMPDVKYAGGLDEMLAIAGAFKAAGVDFSPHNPTGPVCHAASLQIAAAASAFDCLELQFDETPRFDELVGHGLPQVDNGAVQLPDGQAGLGVGLAQEAMGPGTLLFETGPARG
ncbi:hypothetical protein GCM10023144_08070 [Pigmentiphaga soli]|uniref:Mandelate racemase/muconate lactonizing enzyme C-terminal domain-containing protein n=1 Tax=Pigmentiphaga soli TaxID=1007095 RepID=A0ABP8GJL3_9BURK